MQPLLVSRDLRRQDFDSDIAVELAIARKIHLAHPAFAELRADFVTAESRARFHG